MEDELRGKNNALGDIDIEKMIKQLSQDLQIDSNVFRDILYVAIETAQTDVSLLHQAISESNFQEIQSISHRLKGTLLNLRLESLAHPMVQVNALSKTNRDLQNIKILVIEFESLLEQFCKAINI